MFRKSGFLVINNKNSNLQKVLEVASILLHTEIRLLQNIKCYTVDVWKYAIFSAVDCNSSKLSIWQFYKVADLLKYTISLVL